MSITGDHFQGLVSYLIASINGMLKEGNIVTTSGLVVNNDNSIEAIKANTTSKKISDHIELIQKQLKGKAERHEIVTSCISFPNYEKNQIIAFLENSQNYCVKVIIPVVNRNGLHVDAKAIKTEDSAVYIFPVSKLH